MCENHILKGLENIFCQKYEDSQADFEQFLVAHHCSHLLKYIPDSILWQKQHATILLSRNAVLERLKQLYTVVSMLEHEGIPYAVIKGPVLSQAAFNDAFIRPSGDLDMLVRHEDVDFVKKCFISNGFVQGRVLGGRNIQPFTREEILFQTAITHQTAPFVKATLNPICPAVNIDLNFDIMWGECDLTDKPSINMVLNRFEMTSINSFSIRKLSPEIEFIAICLHHYKDLNSIYLLYTNGMQLKLLCDIYFYILNNYEICTPEKLLACTKEFSVTDYVYYCVFYTHLIFGGDILKKYLIALENALVLGQNLLDKFGLDNKERRPWLPEHDFITRLLTPDFYTILDQYLSPQDREKIKINTALM